MMWQTGDLTWSFIVIHLGWDVMEAGGRILIVRKGGERGAWHGKGRSRT